MTCDSIRVILVSGINAVVNTTSTVGMTTVIIIIKQFSDEMSITIQTETFVVSFSKIFIIRTLAMSTAATITITSPTESTTVFKPALLASVVAQWSFSSNSAG